MCKLIASEPLLIAGLRLSALDLVVFIRVYFVFLFHTA